MQQLIKEAIAGSFESSDVQIRITPNPGNKISIELESAVRAQFGASILGTVRQVLDEFGVEDAQVVIHDKGALDCVIRARMQTAICRAAGIRYDWSREDKEGKHV